MLTELHIEHLGVVERLSIRLGPGLTAVTGETGAGKTMLVDALEVVVGGRADATVVRAGAAEARVDARFVVGDRELVLSRVVPADGRSRAYVDGRPATVAALAEATAGLIDLHGQHAHQSLLGAAAQRAALDRFGDVDRAPLRAARAAVTELDAELATLGGDERARAREIDLLRFQVGEIDGAGIEDPDEERRLDVAEDALADAVGHRAAGAAAHAALTGDGGARDDVALAVAALAGRGPFAEPADRLTGVLAELDDLATSLRDATESIDDDPQRLAEVRARRQALRDLCRKYGVGLDEVLAFRGDAAARLGQLERFEQRAAELDGLRADAAAAERAAAIAVGTARRTAAPALGQAVTARLRDLALPRAEIAVAVPADAADPAGERVELLLSANPGSPLLPLSKVASGGELARTMLALRLVLAGLDEPGEGERTLVFDEVDAGIGGTAATAVGEALATLARRHQVLVVTHLAQVAAQATTQLAVSKEIVGDATFAHVEAVDGGRRVDEIARMLSGEDGGEAARRHAGELLDRS